jgi:peptidoglycan/LPS O-acetylase OafA/YrhL
VNYLRRASIDRRQALHPLDLGWEMGKRTKREIIRPINGLRGLTAISVVVVHFTDPFIVLMPALKEFLLFSNRIAFRMDLFFMLSGFMTAYVYIPRGERLNARAWKDFLLARLIRLYPSYLVALLILISGAWYMDLRDISVSKMYQYEVLPSRLALLHAWPFFRSWAWNYPTWFLSALWFAYLFVFPFAWFLVQKLPNSRAACAWVFLPVASWVVFSHLPYWEFQPAVRVSCEFLAGVALFVLVLHKNPLIDMAQRHLDKIVLGFVMLMLAVSSASHAWLTEYVNSALIIATPLLLAGATAERSLTSRFLVSRPLQWLGRISYALFITHAVSQRALNVLLPASSFAEASTMVRFAILIVYWGTILLFALAMYRFVEAPCAAALNKWLRGRTAGGTKSAAEVPQVAPPHTSGSSPA